MDDISTHLTPGALNDLLSPPNLTRLSELSDKSKHCLGTSATDALSSLAAASDEELHEATLLTVAYIASHAQTDLEAAIAGIFIASIIDSHTIDEDLLVKLTAVTDPQDPWTTPVAASAASRILSEQLPATRLTEFIAVRILQGTLKPLFTKSPSSRITASGRPSQYTIVDDRSRDFQAAQPWRNQAPWVEATVQWAVSASTAPLIREHWPSFMPVLLALVEDESIEVKARGLKTLAAFVERCPAQVLQSTGIGRVFVDVTFPLLLYLPSVTPEDQSITVLSPAYDVLIKLAEYTGNPASSERRRVFDKILRDGIFAGHHHASQHARIVQVLMQKTTVVVNCLGIYSSKHLSPHQPLLSMSSSIMTDPFAVAHPPTLRATTQLLGAIIANTWPRVREPEHMDNVIRILSLCWLNLLEELEHGSSQDQSEDLQALSQELISQGEALKALWADDAPRRPPKLDEVLKQEPKLSGLFPSASA
ncbi:uncharacterized protein FIESC28_09163 [Fusarium coffeatum]|uniref:Uncharacterized protein n=1 Tax=Fusarium coffeatum TaxID=231269 RepID=A0A366R1X4_9HYPO|nr:uncharacterized protein FIESC28_09163 [Fusarium coffeatum]RBR11173.1 hypothetical protein FIESC28_09163 [Fusarium coffeatum]